MGISVSKQALSYLNRKQAQSQSALRILSGGNVKGGRNNTVSSSGSRVGKLCVTGQTHSELSLNMYNARGSYSYASSFTGMFHYDVYMYEMDGMRSMGGPKGPGGMVIEDSMLDYFEKNMGNPWKMVNDYNFTDGVKTGCFAVGDRKGGTLTFGYGGSVQAIPASALPELHADHYPALKAENNVLMLRSSSYYRFESNSGGLVWAVTKGGHMRETTTNRWLYGDDNDKCDELSVKAERLLNALKKGNLYGIGERAEYGVSYREIKSVFAAVGIEQGKFSIGVDGEAKDYYYCASGRVIKADDLEKSADWHNSCDYFARGYKEGELVKVTDNLELSVDKNGHIYTSAEEMSRYM